MDDPLSELVVRATLNKLPILSCLHPIILEFYGGDRPKISIEAAKRLMPPGMLFRFGQFIVPPLLCDITSPEQQKRRKMKVRVAVESWNFPVFIKHGKEIFEHVPLNCFLTGGLIAPKPLEEEPVLLGYSPCPKILVELLM